MNEMKLKIVYLPTESLTPYEGNAKLHTEEQIDQIVRSIEEFGMNDPIGIWGEKNLIIEGHGRLEACKKLKMKQVPCIRLDDLTDEQRRAYTLAHNQLTMNTGFDLGTLQLELDKIEDIDMSEFGFDEIKQEPIEIIKDEVPEVDEAHESTIQRGQIYKLGNHYLMCGDSTSESDVDKLVAGGVVDLVFTDPPYGMKKQNEGIENDNLNYDDLLEFNRKWIPLSFRALKKNGSWYCWGIDEPLMDIYSNILRPMKKLRGEDKLTFRNLITWDKGSGQGQTCSDFRMYAIADEKCLFAMMGRQTYGETKEDYWEGFEPIRQALIKLLLTDLKLTKNEIVKYAEATTITHWFTDSQWLFPNEERFTKLLDNLLADGRIDRQEYDKLRQEYDKLRQEFYSSRSYFDNTHDNMNNVWHFKRTSAEERELTGGHATPKPIALCARAIKTSSREGETVLDLFGGSGSTMIACEQLNRKCRMMELEPKYCDVIIKRWETLTGSRAELVSHV